MKVTKVPDVHLEPVALDREFQACTVFGRTAAVTEQKRLVDFLDVDAALNGLDRVGDFEDAARGFFWVRVRTWHVSCGGLVFLVHTARNDPDRIVSSSQKARVAPMFSRQGDGSLKPMAFEMPQRPEFFMGGGALFSTPRNYMAFLQMLLHEGTFNGAQVLKPETVALMRQNHIGDLNVVTLKTVRPESSNDANLFPGMTQKWGLSFDINTEPGPAGRSAGSLAWAGLFNTYFWVDPNKRVTGTIMTQLLPFADDQVLKLFAKFESGLYAAIA